MSDDNSLPFRRVLLKLSGEALLGEQSFGIDVNVARSVAEEVKQAHELGTQIAVVVGGGNIFRGVSVSAGNMAQGLAWAARRRGVRCAVVVPDNAPETKLSGIRRLGGEIVKVPYDDWWAVFATHRFAPLEDLKFVHPVADVGMMAGNGTIGLEILDEVPDVDAVLVPFGGGGLSCGIAAALAASHPDVPVYGCEVETAAPLAAALAHGAPVDVDRTPTFVDGIGGKGVFAEMWPLTSLLLAGSLVASLEEVAAAIRLLAERNRVVAEGAGAAAVAAALNRQLDAHSIVCVVSGGNIDLDVLAAILRGEVPTKEH